MRTTSFLKNKSSGFTLVELAIVLMIIGLLIGGILRGQELMNNARITATVQQVKSYQGAYHTFIDAYGNYPGDMFLAMSRIPGCTAANFCSNGNGDGKIGIPDTDNAYISQTGVGVPGIETSYFWKHLALAHMISGIDPSANPSLAVSGKTHPSAKLGGNFVIFYSKGYETTSSGPTNRFGIGHELRLQPSVNGVGNAGSMALSPIQARLLDQKMDDGRPSSGNVNALSVGSGCEVLTGGLITDQYANVEDKLCTMYFVLD